MVKNGTITNQMVSNGCKCFISIFYMLQNGFIFSKVLNGCKWLQTVSNDTKCLKMVKNYLTWMNMVPYGFK